MAKNKSQITVVFFSLWAFVALLPLCIPVTPVSAHVVAGGHRFRGTIGRASTAASHETSRSAITQRGLGQVRVTPDLKPLAEVRGLWVVRTSITSPEKVANVVETARRYGFNALFVQVRGRGDAYYQSTLEPRAEELSGQPSSFDPLAQIIAMAHRSDIKVYAWLNSCFLWDGGHAPVSPEHIVNAHPDWLMRDRDGNYQLSGSDSCEGAFISPSCQPACDHLRDVFVEVATKYDIDGVHFDYIRYPNQGYDFSAHALAAFKVEMDAQIGVAQQASLSKADRLAYVHAFPNEWSAFRREQVTNLVSEITTAVRTVKPWLVVSAAVYANRMDATSAKGQDWPDWLKKGLIDAVVPMAYGADTSTVAQQVLDAENIAHSSGRVCWAGIGSYHITPDSTDAKIEIARELGAQGVALFSYGGITQDGSTLNYLARLASGQFARQSVFPQMTWIPAKPAQ
jgi:uncharacterized lipoprotein YddW (UPF0748 family)